MASKRRKGSSSRGNFKKQKSTTSESDHLSNIDFLSNSASRFLQQDIDSLRVKFQGASGKFSVIPRNAGTAETKTDSLVDDLLCIVELNEWPTWIENHPLLRLFIKGQPHVSADPAFVINTRSTTYAHDCMRDKHIRKFRPETGFGEVQIAAEMLACGSENIGAARAVIDQIIFGVRVISTYVTFYKAEIRGGYWTELSNGLPTQHSVVIKRWPPANTDQSDLNLADPAEIKPYLYYRGRWVAYKDVQRFEGALSGVNEEVAIGIMVARSKKRYISLGPKKEVINTEMLTLQEDTKMFTRMLDDKQQKEPKNNIILTDEHDLQVPPDI
ncbi:2281_t:CDS:2 [Paraglomus occultum]|uniref:2281_t:CDS:1 n=1 Tax=Paraglomus occultum TaxID=144539 RepID=A0A9N9B4P6_9GLOM|nr:2281_t:CDS:2 [Paraglomus occultum]